MERWKILDDNGNFTGEILGRDNPKVWEKGIYHPGADVWIINSENKILIQKRAKEKEHEPNKWGMTGGSSLCNENTIQTAVREVKEELGIKINDKELKFIIKFKSGSMWMDTYFLRADYDISELVFQKGEVSEVRWASIKEIDKLFSNGEFYKDRWEFLRGLIIKFIKKEI